MIILAGTLTLAAQDLPSFSAAVQAMVGQVRQEDGCAHYSLLVEDAAAGLVNVTEIWRDEAALRVHLAQPWTASFFARFGDKVTENGIRLYDVSGSRPLAL